MAGDVITRITTKLGVYLNKETNDNLSRLLVNFYEKNNSYESFSSYVRVLGLKEAEAIKDIYDLISDNIGSIENQSVFPLKQNEPIKAKPKLSLSFSDDEDELLNVPKFKKATKPKNGTKVSLDFSDDDIEVKPKFAFKRIKKEDADRIKHDILEDSFEVPVNQSSEASKSTKASEDAVNTISGPATPTVGVEQETEIEILENDFANDLRNELQNIENDREWYLEDEQPVTVDEAIPQKNRKIVRRVNSNASSGGSFSTNGEYIDFDHDNSNDIANQVQLTSHIFIPPFLEDSKEYLELSLEVAGGRSIGPTSNPVKDRNSELSLMARKGSHVVTERKSSKERIQKAKERAGINGTAMGNALGVVEEEEHEEENEQDESPVVNIQDQRKSLPAFAVREDLIRTISENQVTIVIGETGSGKTTQLTQFLYEEGFCSNLASGGTRRMIGCTQPRRVAAMSVAKRVSEEMQCVLGQDVGFSIRFEDKTNPKTTMIKYMTDGILLREILTDPLLEQYSCIIMDEAHERSLNTDVLLGLFKQLLARRKDLKLIVTSATMNADRFTRFFGDAPQFTIPGRTFPVDVLYSKHGCDDYVEAAVKQILTIHLQNSQNNEAGDILVFMTGQEDIEVTCELLREKLDMLENPPPLDIFPIYSTLPADLQKKIFKRSKRRKVVVATNIAETSLTVDGIKYVIDTGLVKLKVYNPKLGMDALQVVPISLANAQQRSGRAGRTCAGVAYRLYTERASDNESMYLQPIPEIQRTNLSNVMLLLKSLKVDNINDFSFLDPPPKDLLNCSLYDLWSIGAMDNLGQLTDLGQQMTKFPMEPTLAKAILLSCQPEFHCSEEMITMVSMLSVPSVYYRPKERAEEADMARDKFLINESDHLTLVNVYNQWEINLRKFKNNYSRINQWCGKNFLQLKSLLRAKDIKQQIMLIMNTMKLPILRSKSDDDFRKCLAASFYQQSAKLVKINVHGTPEFANMRHTYMKMYLHPTSVLNGSNLSTNYVVYHELILTTKEYMNFVTTIDPLWLLQYGYIFYDVFNSSKFEGSFNFEYVNKQRLEGIIERDTERYKQLQESKKVKKETKVGSVMQFKRRRGL